MKIEEENQQPVSIDEFHPFVLAALLNDQNIVQQFLESQMSPNYVSNGFNPLWMAAHKGNTEIVELLLQAGADEFCLFIRRVGTLDSSILWAYRSSSFAT